MLRHASIFEVSPKNAHIGVAVNGNTVEVKIESEDLSDRAVKRVVVDCVAAVQQSTVYIEQIGVSSTPVKILPDMRERGSGFGYSGAYPASLQFWR